MRVNWLAIVVAALVFWLFGAIWYFVFGAQWSAALGKTKKELMAAGPVFYPYLVSMIMSIAGAYGVARVLSFRDDVDAGRGAFIGFSLGLLIFGTMAFMDNTYAMQSPILSAINIGYVAIGMAIQGAILGAWKARPRA